MLVFASHSRYGRSHRYVRGPGFRPWTLALAGTTLHLDCGNRAITAPRRHLILISPDTPYALTGATAAWSETCVLFHPQAAWLSLLTWPEAAPGLRIQAAGPAMVLALTQAVDAWLTGGRHGPALAANALERCLLLTAAEAGTPPAADTLVAAAMDLLDRTPGRAWTTPGLATAVHASAGHLTRRFRCVAGESPMRWLMRRRIALAAHLLSSTSLPVKAVAQKCGFRNPFHFTTCFRSHFGRPPSEFRRSGSTATGLGQGETSAATSATDKARL